MVAQITHPHSLKRTLNYNEKKVQQEKAALIHAGNFLQMPHELNFYDKMERLQHLMDLNKRAQTKLIHISLNFHPEDTPKLDKEFLKQVTDEYMQKIGFGHQPYLVYQHHDSGHPHIHVISSLIRSDGSRIDTHNLGRDISKPASQELEEKYGLIKAEKQEQNKQWEQTLKIDPERIQAGKSETKRSIASVLDHVVDKYKYGSLQELNAILKQYNVRADRGHEDGRIYKNRGLTYSVINEAGQQVTKPIKASVFQNKPTLDNIEKKCQENQHSREAEKRSVKTAIEWAMHKQPESLEELTRELQKERIAIVASRSLDGRVFGLTFVDHENKSAFKGSDLGKEYSVKYILERLSIVEKENVQQSTRQKSNDQKNEKNGSSHVMSESTKDNQDSQSLAAEINNNGINAGKNISKAIGKMIEQIIQPDTASSINKELTEEEKRKRKRQQELERD